jgi:hypothetical protein
MGEVAIGGEVPDENLVETIGQMMTGTPLEQIRKEGVTSHD